MSNDCRAIHYYFFSITLLLSFFFFENVLADSDVSVNITTGISHVEVIHNGKIVRIRRIQDQTNIVDLDYAQTSRPCPPYCIQPIKLAPGVETVGELEILKYLQKAGKDESVMVIDSREPKWLSRGMIPGAINIPWTQLYNKTASDKAIANVIQFQFDASISGILWNFENAKTLVFYCNGPWCGQSPTTIHALLSIGYPAHLIKWYRGGMQNWKLLGLTTVKP